MSYELAVRWRRNAEEPDVKAIDHYVTATRGIFQEVRRVEGGMFTLLRDSRGMSVYVSNGLVIFRAKEQRIDAPVLAQEVLPRVKQVFEAFTLKSAGLRLSVIAELEFLEPVSLTLVPQESLDRLRALLRTNVGASVMVNWKNGHRFVSFLGEPHSREWTLNVVLDFRVRQAEQVLKRWSDVVGELTKVVAEAYAQ